MANKNKKSMASKASKTMRSKNASKISKSLAGSVLSKSKYVPSEKTNNGKKPNKKRW